LISGQVLVEVHNNVTCKISVPALKEA
jgi:hypothetical protein